MGSKADFWARVRRNICAECEDSRQAFDRLCSDWDYTEAGYFEMFDSETEEAQETIRQAAELFDVKPDEAFPMFLRLARSGSPIAMHWVGYCYEVGGGVLVDTWKAEHWYTKAVNGGSWFSFLANVKLMDAAGRYDECDADLKQAMEVGFAWAHYWMAALRYWRSPNRQTARSVVHLLEFAIEKGHPDAKLTLGIWCLRGKLGIGQISRGFRMFRAHMRKYPVGFEKLEGNFAPT